MAEAKSHPFIFEGCPCKACGHYRAMRANDWRTPKRTQK